MNIHITYVKFLILKEIVYLLASTIVGTVVNNIIWICYQIVHFRTP